jgi:hypothetical protein
VQQWFLKAANCFVYLYQTILDMKKVLILLVLFFAFFQSNLLAQTDSLQAYVGRYVFQQGAIIPDVSVQLDNGSLVMVAAMGSAALVKTGVDEFSIPSYSGVAVFKRNNDGKVVGVRIEAMGNILEGNKENFALGYFRRLTCLEVR